MPLTSEPFRASRKSLERFLASALSPLGVGAQMQRVWINHLVEANLSGVDSHGLQQIIGYTRSLGNGRINPSAQPRIQDPSPGSAVILMDGDGGCGQFVAEMAMNLAMERAKVSGIAVVGVVNSNHFGMAGHFTRMAALAGFIGFATSDTNVADLAPFGGAEPRLGNNPCSWGIPTGTDAPVVLDMATGAVSGGKIKHFGYNGLGIPTGWGMTAQGEPTDDPNQVAFNAASSFKGSGMAFVFDLLCGPLLGTAMSHFKQKSICDSANGTGHLILAIHPGFFSERDAFFEEVRNGIRALKETPRTRGNEEILYPGEWEYRTRKARLKDGVVIPAGLLAKLSDCYGAAALEALRASHEDFID